MVPKKKTGDNLFKSKNIKIAVIICLFTLLIFSLRFFTSKQNDYDKNKSKAPNAQTASTLTSGQITPTPTIYYYSTSGKNLADLKEKDPKDESGMYKTYTDKKRLFTFKYPVTWSRIVVEIYGSSQIEEFFEDGIEPELHDSDGVGNDAFYINHYDNYETLAEIKAKIGSVNTEETTVGNKPALKSGDTYHVKTAKDKTLFIITRYTDRINCEEVLDSFTLED